MRKADISKGEAHCFALKGMCTRCTRIKGHKGDHARIDHNGIIYHRWKQEARR